VVRLIWLVAVNVYIAADDCDSRPDDCVALPLNKRGVKSLPFFDIHDR
jgi:hypothetical protein